MTVPSQYKGFSKLPEHVQQKMDPELAKKYNMGGGVLQRPLFRQMGGPAEAMQPAPMPAPPPPPPPIPPQGDPMVQQTEAQFANIGEQLAQDTMRNIDQAQDIEGAINGLRGNEKPIEARYDELAGFVGQSDAQQTPESVLAMVQPTIMMTEQGAMDSGIGELIQSIAGSDMETPTGEPTPMGQGVGELMAMGAGNTPPVNFNQGGPVEVRRYALGDPQGVVSRATQLQSEFLPLFQQILGTEADRQAELDEIKRMQRSQAGFDLARAGLALASPTDRPMSFVEKLAAAATPLTTSLQQRGDIIQKAKLAQKAQDRQAETSALTAALGQAQTEAAQAFDLKKLGAKAQADLRKAEQKYGFDVALKTLDFTNEKAINIQVEDLKRKSEELKQTRGFENDLELQAEKAEIDKTLAKFKGAIELENNLTLQGVKSADKIKEMKEQKEITEAINATQQAYSLANKEVDQKNSLIKQAIEIAAQDSRQDKSLAANEALVRLKNTFDVEESDKNRVFQAAQNELTRLLTERGLTLDEAKFEADQILNNEKLILQKKEQAFNQEIKTKEVARDRFETIVEDGNIFVRDKDNPEAPLKTLIEAVEEYNPDFMDFTDNQTNETTLVDMNSDAGKQALAKQTADPSRYSITKVPTTRQRVADTFIIQSEGRSKYVTSYDGGRTYVNERGDIISLSGLQPIRLSPENSFKIIQVENKKNIAGEKLREFEQRIYGVVKTGTKEDPKAISKEDSTAMRNAFEAARTGTGFYANLFAFADAATGIIPFDSIRGLFKDTQASRQYLRALEVLGRSALVVNPRFPVAELEKVGLLFPRPDAFFANPQSEAEKLIILKETAEQQYIRNLEQLRGSISEDIRAQVESNNFEIDRLLHLLQGVPSGLESNTQSSTENEANVESLGKYIQSTRTNTQETN